MSWRNLLFKHKGKFMISCHSYCPCRTLDHLVTSYKLSKLLSLSQTRSFSYKL